MNKVITFLLMATLLISIGAYGKKNDEGLVQQYQAEGAGATTDASHQIKVTILSKKKNVTEEELGKCAVHASLFQDIDDTTNAGYGSSAIKKSIMGSPAAEAQHIDYFEPFFRNGDCNRYVQQVKDYSVVKSGKLWKISGIVKVNYAQLKKDLNKKGLVKNLGSGW